MHGLVEMRKSKRHQGMVGNVVEYGSATWWAMVEFHVGSQIRTQCASTSAGHEQPSPAVSLNRDLLGQVHDRHPGYRREHAQPRQLHSD